MRQCGAVLLGLSLLGCATIVPYTGQGPYPQLSRGAPVLPIDILGNILALPSKLLLFTWRFDSHSISVPTETKLIEYLRAQDLAALNAAHFQLNEYNPAQDLSRLIHNPNVAWPYRALIGVPVTLFTDVLLPGRLFPWGDYYNPYTNTVHLFSDHPAISLHEAGHVHDLATRTYKGTYSALRLLPFVDLYQEYKATAEAIAYLKRTGDRPGEISAYKILYPAYGSYVGSYLFPPIGTIGGVLGGHFFGHSTAAYETYHDKHHPAATPPPAAPTVTTPSTVPLQANTPPSAAAPAPPAAPPASSVPAPSEPAIAAPEASAP